MSKDRNFERRMIVSKYSNRPPFDLKKPKEFYDIEDKMKAYPDETCNNCCKNRSGKIRVPVRPSKSSLPPKDPKNEPRIPAVKKVIPKIIKTFQQLTPSTEDTTLSQNTSIQTLYRNPKPCQLGKNIPKHKLMKSLLQNLDSEAEHGKKSLPNFVCAKHKVATNKCKSKHKRGKKQFFDKDEIIRPDFSVNLDGKRESQDALIKNVSFDKARPSFCCNMPQKVDKRTSTTGLPWPPNSNQYSFIKIPSGQRVNSISSHSYRCNRMEPSKSRTNKSECKKTAMSSSESYLEEMPTKNVAQPLQSPVEAKCIHRFREKPHETSKTPQKPGPKNSLMNHPLEKRCEFQGKNSISKLKSREKTFVQAQVEKLNKVMRLTKIPGLQNQSCRTAKRDFVPRKCERHGQGDVPNSRAGAANYMGLMDRIKENCPRYDDSDNCRNSESEGEWSDPNDNTEIVPEQIRFPRETKTAVDQHLSERRQRLPLSKFTKVHHCRPAIRSNTEFVKDIEYFEDKNQQGQLTQENQKATKNRDLRTAAPAPNRFKLNLPCKRNLLCDRGEHHSGPCGYTHNHNKVIY